jgi:putative flippase GtrA
MNEVLLKFIKFCTVGGSGVIVDFSLTYLCKEKFRLNKYLSNSIGFMIAASSNYILNRIWTFGSLNQDIKTEYLSFIFVSIVGLLINNLTFGLCTKK